LSAGHVKGGQGAVDESDYDEMPEVDQSRDVQCGQEERHDGISALAHDDHLPSGDAVCQYTSQQGGKGEGQGKGHHYQRQSERRVVCKPKDKPPSGDLLHGYRHE